MTTSNDTPELDAALRRWAGVERTLASEPAFVRQTMARLRRRRRWRRAISLGAVLAATTSVAMLPGAQGLVDGWTWLQEATSNGHGAWLVPAAVLALSWLLPGSDDDGVLG